MENDEQLQRFFELCENSSFPHREEIINQIRSKEVNLHSYSQTKSNGKQFFDIYKFRGERLAKSETEYGKRLSNEIKLLCDNLEISLEDEIGLWIFSKKPNWIYAMFENIRTKKILGCTLGTDKRIVSENDYEKYW